MYEFKLFLTSKCNLMCEYCYENNVIRRSMSKETMISAIKFFMENAVENSEVYLNLFGGEPLIEFELIEFGVEYFKELADEKGLKCKFKTTTNATLLNTHMIEFFKRNGFYINVSLDGDRDTHNKTRRDVNGSGTFDKVWDKISLLKESNCDFNVRMTVTPDNVDNLEHNIKWLVKNDINNLNISPNFFADWGETAREKLVKAYGVLKEIYMERSSSLNRLTVNSFDGKLSKYMFDGKALFCSAGTNHFMTSPEGKLYPCSYVMDNEEFICGDVVNGLDNSKRKYILGKYVSPKGAEKCHKCEIAYFCHGRKCSYYNLRSTGFLNVCDEFICFHEQILYKIVNEIVDELYKRGDKYMLSILKKVKPVIEKFPELTVNKKVQAYVG